MKTFLCGFSITVAVSQKIYLHIWLLWTLKKVLLIKLYHQILQNYFFFNWERNTKFTQEFAEEKHDGERNAKLTWHRSFHICWGSTWHKHTIGSGSCGYKN